MADFIDEFFKGTPESRQKAFTKKSQHAIKTDRWDRLDHQSMVDQVTELDIAERQIEDFTKTGQPAMADLFYSLLQAMPKLKDSGELDPEYRINGAVATEVRKVPEFDDLRSYTISDQISTALSTASMEPTLEVIFDKLNELQKMADEIKEAMQGFGSAESEMNDLLEKLAQGGLSEEEEQELKDKIEELQEKMEELEGQAREQSESLDDQLEERGYDIRSAMGEAMTEALGKAQGMANLGMVWGSEPGEFKKMDPQQRLELSKKIDNPRFRQLAELIGPMIHMAIGAQRDKVHYVPEEIYDIELGNDLTRITTSEWINMGHPILRYDFMRRFMEHGLTQRVMRGTEKQAKGGIIACTDGSGSMSGMKEIWAMAVTLALLRIARNQKRPFTGIQFGSAGIYKRWVFDTTAKTLKVTIDESGVEGTRTLEGVEAVLDYASTFLCGGTDFMTPFNLAIEQLTTEHTEKGAVDGDIVFITDGECSVTTEWEEKYFETQEALGFKTFGIAIGCSPTSQPLAKLCDNQVTGVTDLVASNAPKSIFGMV